jgi:hypothetical protein
LFTSWIDGFGGPYGFYNNIRLDSYSNANGAGSRWIGDGYQATNYFEDTSSITAPAGLSNVNTLGKRRSLRSRITFELNDWSSKSFNIDKLEPVGFKYTNPLNQQCYIAPSPLPWLDNLECAAGGRYAFAPGDSGWRLQSVTNYSGSVAPVMPNGLILYSPNGTAYQITVNNAGSLSTLSV